jgi:hypothetical protein
MILSKQYPFQSNSNKVVLFQNNTRRFFISKQHKMFLYFKTTQDIVLLQRKRDGTCKTTLFELSVSFESRITINCPQNPNNL